MTQRYEFLRRFKYKRMEYDQDILSKKKVQTTAESKAIKKKLSKFFHSNEKKTVMEFIKNLDDKSDFNFDLSNIIPDQSYSGMKEKLKRIDTDFNTCISHMIMSEKQLFRSKRRHNKRDKPKDLPKGAAIDMIEIGIKNLKRMKTVNDIVSSYENSSIKSPYTIKRREGIAGILRRSTKLSDKIEAKRKSSGGRSTTIDYRTMITSPKYVDEVQKIIDSAHKKGDKQEKFRLSKDRKIARSVGKLERGDAKLSIFMSGNKRVKRNRVNSQSFKNIIQLNKKENIKSINIFG